METYSLIQPELGAKIDRQTLEEASVAAPSVGKADCARIARELFGIIVSGLPIEDALAFRAALLARDFPTEIAADSDLPQLPEGRHFSRVDTNDEAVTFSDALGRREIFRAADVLLLAGGFMQHLKNKTQYSDFHIPYVGTRRNFEAEPVLLTKTTLEPTDEFRFEVFLNRKPYRLRLLLTDSDHILWNGIALRLGKPDPIHAFMKTWNRHAPRAHRNLGLTNSGTDFTYPSPRAFENELRWRFYKLKQRASQK